MPAVDTADPGGGDVTTTHTVDVNGERVRSWDDSDGSTTTTRTHHYSGDDDSPDWTDESGSTWTRTVVGLDNLAAITTTYGTTDTDWQLVNLHGDCVATVRNSDLAVTTTSETTEYGQMRDPAHTGTQRYGWLGAKQRAADTPSGIILMGVRLYNPTLGRFLQTDPVYGGSANDYDYCNADPINCFDLDGRWSWGKILDRTAAGLAVAGLFGCGVCAAASAGISLGRGIYKVAHGDRSGWWDIAGSATFGAGKILRAVNNGRKLRAIARAPKGVPGRGMYYKRLKQKAAYQYRNFNGKYTVRADRIDKAYGVFGFGKTVHDEYRQYRSTRRFW